MADTGTIDVYNQRAGEYADLTMADDTVSPRLAAFMAAVTDAVTDGARVLDLGCGPGRAAAAMARAGFTVQATDASAEMVSLAVRHPDVTAHVAVFEDIAGQDVYDGVWANFSLLHAERDRMPAHLAALRMALKPGGVFHIGMKTGDGAQRDGIGRFYTYYTDAELSGLLEQAGFTIQDRSSGCDKGLDGTMADWVCILAHA